MLSSGTRGPSQFGIKQIHKGYPSHPIHQQQNKYCAITLTAHHVNETLNIFCANWSQRHIRQFDWFNALSASIGFLLVIGVQISVAACCPETHWAKFKLCHLCQRSWSKLSPAPETHNRKWRRGWRWLTQEVACAPSCAAVVYYTEIQ